MRDHCSRLKAVNAYKKATLVTFKCDVHPWMAAYIGVFDHPYFDVSGDDGTYSIPSLPKGTYTIEAWHERLGTKTATVTVGALQKGLWILYCCRPHRPICSCILTQRWLR